MFGKRDFIYDVAFRHRSMPLPGDLQLQSTRILVDERRFQREEMSGLKLMQHWR